MKASELITWLQSKNPETEIDFYSREFKQNRYVSSFNDLKLENIHEGLRGEVYEEGELIEEGDKELPFIVIGCPVI